MTIYINYQIDALIITYS